MSARPAGSLAGHAGGIIRSLSWSHDKMRLRMFRGFPWQLARPLAPFLTYALVDVARRFSGAVLALFRGQRISDIRPAVLGVPAQGNPHQLELGDEPSRRSGRTGVIEQ